MKTRSIGVLGAASFATVASMFVASAASAQVLGLTATTRLQTDGNYLVNVWAVTGAYVIPTPPSTAANAVISVSGGQNGSITTNAVGGFRQGTGTQGVWAPAGAQNWNTLDSFLTVGGSFLTSSQSWTANTNTGGDPNWNVSYFDTSTEEQATANAFNTPSNSDNGFINPYITSVAPAGGWVLPGGTSSIARSLALLTNRQNADAAGQAAGSAAAGSNGVMIAQFYVSGTTSTGAEAKIFFNGMRVFLAGGLDARTIDTFTINIPAPGAVALLGLAGLAGRRRRA
jgi:hypothetical protein